MYISVYNLLKGQFKIMKFVTFYYASCEKGRAYGFADVRLSVVPPTVSVHFLRRGCTYCSQ